MFEDEEAARRAEAALGGARPHLDRISSVVRLIDGREPAISAAPPPAEPATAEAPAAAAPRQSWLRENRLKVALGIAVAEGLFVALEEDFSRVTVIVIAIPVILFWLLAGRTLDSELGREISWILAMSQALAVCAAVVAIFIPLRRARDRGDLRCGRRVPALPRPAGRVDALRAIAAVREWVGRGA